MLKAVLKNSLIATLSTVFVFIAGGYNFVDYCCSSCEEQGIELLLTESCASAHEHDEHQEADKHVSANSHACCTDISANGIHADHHQNDCQIYFLKLDELVSSTTQSNFKKSLTEKHSEFLPLLFFVAAYKQMAELKPKKLCADDGVKSSGREILASVCILRI